MLRSKKNRESMIAAFTVSELVVVALLTVLTVSIGFTALDLLDRQFRDYEKDSSQLLGNSDLTRLLNRDFFLCQKVETRTGREVDLRFDSMTISYLFQNDYIIRMVDLPGVTADSFQLAVTDIYANFRGEEVQFGPVDFLQLFTLIDGREQELLFSKTYAAEDFYKME